MLGNSASFGAADDAAGDVIASIDENYTPWFAAPFESIFADGKIPGELESLLFCLQAAAGSGIFFFVLGRLTMRSKMRKALTENGIDIEKAESSK
jgi:cobalt/nickel transport protein